MLSIYKASAGSGKTYTLTREYLKMMLTDYRRTTDSRLPHSHILAVTFTKKATAEMKERILQSLYTLSVTPTESPYLKDLIRECHLTENEIQSRAKSLMVGILQDYTHFSVSTIDGFFQQVIRTFAMELGLPTTYDLSMDGEEIILQAVDDIFLQVRNRQDDTVTGWLTAFSQDNIDNDSRWNPKDAVGQFSRELLREQLIRHLGEVRKAFADKDGLRRYQAELKRICSDTEQYISQLQAQVRTLTNGVEGMNTKALIPFTCPIDKLISDGLKSTFLKVLDNPKSLCTVSKTTKAQQADIAALYEQHLQLLFREMHDLFTGTRMRDYYTADAILRNLYATGLLQDVAGQVEATNRRLGRLPISDINILINNIIDGQDAPFIYERIGQYLHHFMMDEFQDTSSLQWENFRPLIQEAEAFNRSNLIVGDVKQSIYRWRNSEWRLLDEVEHEFANTCLPAMKDNWRTAPVVVAENEEVIARYSKWVADRLDANATEWHTPDLSDSVRRIYAPQSVHQDAKKHLPGVFQMQFFDSENVEQQCLDALPPLLEQLQHEGFAMGDIAMLVRQTSEAETLSHYLIDHGYNVQSAEGLRVQSHPAVQLIVCLLQQQVLRQQNTVNEIVDAQIRQLHPIFTDDENAAIGHACLLPLYEQVQSLIGALRLTEQEGALPYLTTFQDYVYQFTQNRVADVASFLEYWERKSRRASVPSPDAGNAIRIMTIHSSKGLEFDVVILPFLTWDVMKIRATEVLWCTPQTEPFSRMPLVAVPASSRLLNTWFRDDYIREVVSQYIDNLNLTYVAFTRPKYRLYVFGEMCSNDNKGNPKIANIGHLLSHLYRNDLDETGTYLRTAEGDLSPRKHADTADTHTREAQYVSSPIGERLMLRSRAEDDFTPDTPLATIDLGILMHEWLSCITTWNDADSSLQRLWDAGRVTATQAPLLREQLQQLSQLLESEQHTDWFDGTYSILTERDILMPEGSTCRPDRVMLSGNHAVVIDYKFGSEHKRRYHEQVRDYMTMLQRMGYTTDGYLIYVAMNKIEQV